MSNSRIMFRSVSLLLGGFLGHEAMAMPAEKSARQRQ